MKKTVVVIALLALSACASVAPQRNAAQTDPAILATVQSLYDVISGQAGARDWTRFQNLMAPDARLIVMRNGAPVVLSVDQYITRVTANTERVGFFERAIANRVEQFGDIAHVFSTYESRHAANDEKPFARGINSFQLARIGGQWKVLSILWQNEDEQHPIPAAYQ